MARKNERISTNASAFAVYMQNTDNLQLANGITTGTKKWQNWGWTAAQSAQWSAFRTQSDLLYPQYADKNHNSTGIIAQMNLLIKATKKYDNDPLTGNHLLERIGLYGTLSDCETFHVKRNTALANVSHLGAAGQRSAGGVAVGTGASWVKPILTIKKYDVCQHHISVTNPNTPNSHALPKGIKFAKIYRYVGTVEPTGINQYLFIGNAKQGAGLSSFADADLAAFATGTAVYAWYIARYESNKGVLFDASGVLYVRR
jgi:hypothetical protein